jgi:hypothetical protein
MLKDVSEGEGNSETEVMVESPSSSCSFCKVTVSNNETITWKKI